MKIDTVNTVVELLKEYKLINEIDLSDIDLDDSNIEDILDNLYNKSIICVMDLSEPPGAWEAGKLIDEYSSIVENIVKASNGKITIKNFKATNKYKDDEREGIISIEFDDRKNHYEWKFSPENMDSAYDYYIGVLKWAENYFKDELYCCTNEFLYAFILPFELLKELKNITEFPGDELDLYKKEEWSLCQDASFYIFNENKDEIANILKLITKYTETLIYCKPSKREWKKYIKEIDSKIGLKIVTNFYEETGHILEDDPYTNDQIKINTLETIDNMVTFKYSENNYMLSPLFEEFVHHVICQLYKSTTCNAYDRERNFELERSENFTYIDNKGINHYTCKPYKKEKRIECDEIYTKWHRNMPKNIKEGIFNDEKLYKSFL